MGRSSTARQPTERPPSPGLEVRRYGPVRAGADPVHPPRRGRRPPRRHRPRRPPARAPRPPGRRGLQLPVVLGRRRGRPSSRRSIPSGGAGSAPTPSACSPRPLRTGWSPPPPAPSSSPRVAALALLARGRSSPPSGAEGTDPDHPVAFLCAEFAVHASLPIYSGGLGVLAGDILKEASDLALPMVGVGLLYRTGLLPPAPRHLRLPARVLARQRSRTAAVRARHRRAGGEPLVRAGPRRRRGRRGPGLARRRRSRAAVPARHRLPGELHRRTLDHLAALRGHPLGPPRPVRASSASAASGCSTALGIEPSVVPPQRGPPCLALAALDGRARGAGSGLRRGLGRARERLVFTTHTPVPAGNETYAPTEVRRDAATASPTPTGDPSGSSASAGSTRTTPTRRSGMTAVGPARRPIRQRREPPPRRGGPRDVAAAVRRRRRRRAHHPRHQRRARPHLAGPADEAPARPPPRRRLAGHAPTTRPPGTAVDDIPDDELWDARTASRAPPRRVRPRAVRQRPPPPRRGPSATSRRRRTASTPSASPSASPAAWPPTSGCTC